MTVQSHRSQPGTSDSEMKHSSLICASGPTKAAIFQPVQNGSGV
jgi:hypothetical protein